jgi:Helix-turn-helix domain
MDDGIGTTLREARNRRKVDLSEVEKAIKIRPRYLRAMENEEWDALPGGAYTRGFIRTYAAYLGLDGERLAEDYRRAEEPSGGDRVPKRIEPVPTGTGQRRLPRITSGTLLALVALALIVAVVAIGLATGGGGGGGSPSSDAAHGGQRAKQRGHSNARAVETGVELAVAASGEVWACVLDGAGNPVLDGQILEPGAEAGPYRGKRFTMAFGNGQVDLKIDGNRAPTESSNSPIGYEVTPKGKLKPLEEGERPTCE